VVKRDDGIGGLGGAKGSIGSFSRVYELMVEKGLDTRSANEFISLEFPYLADYPGIRIMHNWSHLRSRINTTSCFCVPRLITSRLPSRDKSKFVISSLLKWVICFGVPPAIGWLQILSTPPSFLV
jgi:hypothetical protein